MEEIKPHAVKLILPKDGSTPDVLPWQSLRKCSKAAPELHGDYLDYPNVDSMGRIVVSPPAPAEANVTGDAPSAPDDPEGWDTWTRNKVYDIEKIVRAERRGRGWTVYVKWEGVPTATPEPLSKLLGETNHPQILQEIRECQEKFYDEFPESRPKDEETQLSHVADRPRREGVVYANIAQVCTTPTSVIATAMSAMAMSLGRMAHSQAP